MIDSMCGDPISDLLYLAIPTVLLGAGAFFMIGKDGRKKIEEIIQLSQVSNMPNTSSVIVFLIPDSTFIEGHNLLA